MQIGSAQTTKLLNPAVIVAALGNFVDTYDLVLFGVVRIASLKDLGYTGEALTNEGTFVLDMQMFGMLLGGILWGVMGDKRGRLSVLFGSIFLYSIANIANGFVESIEAYALWRFIAGIGLAGELGAGITLVTEVMPKERRGYGAMIVAAMGLLGAVAAGWTAQHLEWRTSYFIGGILGIMLLLLRVSVRESGMFESVVKHQKVGRGEFLALFTDFDRFLRYLKCILMGLPIWYVIGILIVLSPEFGKILGIKGEINPGTAIMISYGGGALGDLLSGTLSQFLKSRLKVMVIFICLDAIIVILYHNVHGWSLTSFYAFFFLFGIGGGFWLILLTISAEQFGTNIRATVTTTVPNFIRGAFVIVSWLFGTLKMFMDFYYASITVGVICFGVALISINGLEETFGKDMDYTEEL